MGEGSGVVLARMLLYFVAAWGAAEVGGLIGERVARRRAALSPGSVTPAVSSILGLLALVLAFAFGHAASRFDERRHMLVEDANAIGTYHLRTGLLEEGPRREARRLLREYVELRTEPFENMEALAAGIARSESIQRELWDVSMASTLRESSGPLFSLYLAALNQMIDVHGKRVAVATRHKIPPSLWFGFHLISVLAFFAIGFQAGALERSRPAMAVPLALAMALLIGMIWDLEETRTVLAHVDPAAMRALRDTIAKGQ